MCALGTDPSLAQYDDLVCPADLGEAVGDQEGRASLAGLFDGQARASIREPPP